ncbi:MAG: RnfABCDGE type electron transport complex subunit B [Saezia sp.]
MSRPKKMPRIDNHLTPLQRQALVQVIHEQLPQTQCQCCGFHDCEAYAQAIAEQKAEINRCQPGGSEGIQRLAKVTGQKSMPLAEDVGKEAPRTLAIIDEQWCIGCTKCIQVCPVDAIMGSSKKMHIILEEHCTGCELCLPACPTDCIQLLPTSTLSPSPTGWAAWSQEQADNALKRYRLHSLKKKKRTTVLPLSKNEMVADNIALTSEHQKRDFMAEIMRKAQLQKK